jgi:hypothetical protein
LPVVIAAGGFAACGFLLFLQLLVFQRLVRGGILRLMQIFEVKVLVKKH